MHRRDEEREDEEAEDDFNIVSGDEDDADGLPPR
jgi:hypothetical protein